MPFAVLVFVFVMPTGIAVKFVGSATGTLFALMLLAGCTSKSSSKNNAGTGGLDAGQDANSSGGSSGSGAVGGTSGAGGTAGSSGAGGSAGTDDAGGLDGSVDSGTGLPLAPKSVALGGEHGCAVHPNSGVVCWGKNAHGNLGRGFVSGADAGSSYELDVKPVVTNSASTPLTNVTRVVAGLEHTCALVGTGMYCWGNNESKQLGANAGNSKSSALPVLISASSDIIDIAAGDKHSCAALKSGGVKCWGDQSEFQLGVAGVTLMSQKILAIQAGGNSSCAITDAAPRELYCWGSNEFSQLSSKEAALKSINAVKIEGMGEPRAVAVGTTHICAIDSKDALWCWGKNFEGQVGNSSGGSGQIVKDPTQVAGDVVGKTALDVEAGFNQSCALVRSGQASPQVYCWGGNSERQLGQAGIAANTVPLLVSGIGAGGSPVIDVATLGNVTGCARNALDAIYCWGANGSGQAGTGTTMTPQVGPLLMLGFP